ncbi:MAG: N-acetyltransferase [Actinobacteria bacterium]|nr:N-acetyltransferase [Actinomycetota bacterium]
MMVDVDIRHAEAPDAGPIGAIYDEAILEGVSTFAVGPHPAGERIRWLESRSARAPVFVARQNETVLGWSALAPFSTRPWFDGVAEYTVYVAAHARGARLGTHLIDHLVGTAASLGYWKLVGMILPENTPGLALAARAGFDVVGTHRAHARLGDRWQDVTIVERHVDWDVAARP